MNCVIERYKSISTQVKASFWFLICSFLQKGIMVITTPVFTRLMSTEEYGQFGVFNSWMSIISVFVTLNLYSGMYTRGLVKYSNRKEKFSSSLQTLILILTLVWTLIYYIFHNKINDLTSLTTVQTLCMFLLIWTSSAFNFWASEQRVDLHYKALVSLTLMVSVLKPVIGICLVKWAADKVTARILGLAAVELVFFSGCFCAQIKRGKTLYDKQFWNEAFLFNIPLVPHYLSLSVLNGADKVMIERMIGTSEAGIYSLAYQISQVMMLFNTALAQTLEPWLYKKINEDNIDDIKHIAYPTWIFIAVMNILLICFAPEIVTIFAPADYYQAIWVIPPIAISVYFIFLYTFFAVFEFYYTTTKLAAIATCTGAILNVVLNYIFLKIYGYYAAGYTTLFCYITYAFMHYIFMRHIVNENMNNRNVYSIKIIIYISLLFIAAGFLIMSTYNYPVIRFSVIGFICIVCIFSRNRIIGFVRQMISVRTRR